jgi:hypothetical protein
MGKDTPSYDRSAKERGLYARESNDPTLGSYLSSLLYLLAVPGFILLAYGGYWAGVWDYGAIIPVFAGLLVATLVIVFVLMHVFTGR